MMIIRGMNIYPTAIEQILHSFPEVVEYRLTARKHGALDELVIEVEDHLQQPDADRRRTAAAAGPEDRRPLRHGHVAAPLRRQRPAVRRRTTEDKETRRQGDREKSWMMNLLDLPFSHLPVLHCTMTATNKLELTTSRLRITWSDGQVRDYSLRELRDKCPCATCREKRNAPPPSPLQLPIISAAEAQPLRITA